MAAKNRYASSGDVIGPAVMLRAITPYDTNELEWVTNNIIASGAGAISIIAQGDTDPASLPAAMLGIRLSR